MVVRVLFKREVRRTLGATRQAALAAAALITPMAFTAFALGLWRIGADMKLTSEFAISNGPLSRWQAWIGAGIVLELVAVALVRFAARGLDHMKAN